MIKQLLLPLLGTLMLSCANPASNSVDKSGLTANQNKELFTLHENVMEVHDEVMPKISELKKYSRNLKTQMKNLDEASKFTSEELEFCINKLDSADKAMFDWMAQYKMPQSPESFDETSVYLKDQMEKIVKVKNDILGGLQDASKLSAILIEENK